jgi:fibronectin-binding autotransporter adhesin
LAPGHSPGCISSGDLVIAGTYKAEIGGATACSEYDQMKVTGTVDLTGGTLTSSLYNSYIPKAGEVYTIIDNDAADAVTGTFAGLAEGATFTLGSTVLKISYKGGTGNDVTLSVVSTPTAPNTGLVLLKNNPLGILGLTLLSAMGLLYASHRIKRITKTSGR